MQTWRRGRDACGQARPDVMSSHFIVLNAFIEDTCVLAMIAYLLGHGRVLDWLFGEGVGWRESVYLGALLGLIGLSEIIFPGARYPYVSHTLLITFATLVGGLRVGSIAAATIVLCVGVL